MYAVQLSTYLRCQIEIRFYKYITSKSVLVCLEEINMQISGKHSLFNEDFRTWHFTSFWIDWFYILQHHSWEHITLIKTKHDCLWRVADFRQVFIIIIFFFAIKISTVQHLFATTWALCLFYTLVLFNMKSSFVFQYLEIWKT